MKNYFNVDFKYDNEEFRPLIFDSYDFSNKYLISNYGRIKSMPNCKNGNRYRILKFKEVKYERRIVFLRKENGYHEGYIHILVAKVFIPNPENLPVVSFKNKNRKDIRVDNLFWSKKTRTRPEVIKVKIPKIKVAKIPEIINTYELKSIIINNVITTYKVHRDGYVLNHKNEILKGYRSKGYVKIDFRILGKRIIFRMNRLVAEAFIPNPNFLPEVNHIDCNKLNNAADNLEWCTRKQNMAHARANGLLKIGKRLPKLKNQVA